MFASIEVTHIFARKGAKNTIYFIYLIFKYVVVSEDISLFTLAVIAIICAWVTFYGISMI